MIQFLRTLSPLSIFTILIFNTYCIGQDGKGTISGSIKDTTGNPINNASISVDNTSFVTKANITGEFSIKNVPAGSYSIVVTTVNSEKIIKNVTVENNLTSTLNFTIKEGIHHLGEVVISSEESRYTEKLPSTTLRIKSPIIETPQNIQIITSNVLKDQQILSMSDGIVRNVSGLIRAEHWGDLYTNIVTRGSQMQAFRNGFNVVNSKWGPLTEDMSFVDNIEFVKGPASFMLASGDPSGMYNVVTKKPTGINKGEACITVGSFNLYRSTLDLDGKLSRNGKLLYRLNLAAQNKQTHRDNEYNDRYVIAPVISYQLDSVTKLTAEYTYQRANMSNVGSYYMFSTENFATLPRNFTVLPAGTPGNKINDHSIYLNLQHDLSKTWKITAQLSQFIYDQEGHSMWPSSVNADGTIIRNIGIWDATSKMEMGQVFVNGDVNTGFIRHRILGGIDMADKKYLADWNQKHDLDTAGGEFNFRNPILNLDNGFPVFDRSKPLEERAYLNGSFQTQSYASVYLQDELGFLNNKLRLTLAGRYTKLREAYYGSDSANHFTPRVALSVSLNSATTLYGLYDQAFVPQSGILSNRKNVQPITGNNLEVGLKRDWFGGKLNTTLAVYQIVKYNEITQDPFSDPNSGLSIVLGEKAVKGIEFDVRGSIVEGFDIIANYSYTDSRITKVSDGITFLKKGDIVPRFSKHVINAWLNYKLTGKVLKNFGISAGCTWLVDRATYWEASPDPNKQLADYLKVDGGLFYDNNKIRITANIFNALDNYLYSGSYASYFAAPAYSWQTEAPRNFRLSINYKF